MTSPDQVVLIVDDDSRVREALQELLSAFDLNSLAFGSATEYIAHPKPEVPACLLLDLQLPDISGLELQRQLSSDYHPPIIFITGHGDIPSSVRAMKGGAIDFLTKPFSDEELLRLVHTGLALDRDARLRQAEQGHLQRRFQSLTTREREVLPLVVGGLLNKQAAAHLGISEVTLQIHRTNVMKKMEADSFAELVRMAAMLGISVTLNRRS
jgi:FixJ family two-component response regulator